jgi:hypothetical protein
MAERDVIDSLLVQASRVGIRLSRNNSGVAHYPDGATVAYGTFRPGGSDLLGWVPHIVTAEDVGKRVAIFCAVELKGKKDRPTDEQQRFLTAVERAGGIAVWGRDADAILGKILKWPPP